MPWTYANIYRVFPSEKLYAYSKHNLHLSLWLFPIMCTKWVLDLQIEELPTMSAQFSSVMNWNSRQISCLFPHTYCAIKISPPQGSIWAWREYNFPQWIILQLSKQQDHGVVQSKKLMAMGVGIMRGSTWRKQFMKKKKNICQLFLSVSWAAGTKKSWDYICNAKTLFPQHLIPTITLQQAVKTQFQLRCLRKYI